MARFESRIETTRFVYLANEKGTQTNSPIEKASIRDTDGTFIIWLRDLSEDRRHSIMMRKSDIPDLRAMLDLIEKDGK